MKPVAVFRHTPTEGPGYFATYLETRNLSWTLLKTDAGEPVPFSPHAYSGLVFMGGPMSVNDPLPWIESTLALIRRAVEADIPVLGHCLGGQLIARALGGEVTRNPVKEIGWGVVTIAASDCARRWFGNTTAFESFHWHGETFTVPAGAELIASSAHCANQCFALGRHLAMQCHVEMTPELIRAWCRDWEKEVASLAARIPSVQTPEEMQVDLQARTERLNRVAAAVYERWVEGLAG